jgi:hypothetical protein
MKTHPLTPRVAVVTLVTALSCVALFVAGCDGEAPTTASVRNDYPAPVDGGAPAAQNVVLRVWYATTLFASPVAPGVTSEEERTVPGEDYVYAVLAVGWDPASGAPPSRVIPLRSKGRLAVKRGDLGLVTVSPATFDGDCAAGSPLSQDDADFVTQRIFPGAFAGLLYDAATCTARAPTADGGAADAAGE